MKQQHQQVSIFDSESPGFTSDTESDDTPVVAIIPPVNVSESPVASAPVSSWQDALAFYVSGVH